MTSAPSLVVFTPSGHRGRFAQGTTVLQAARSLGVDIDSVCGGRALCGRCQVQVGEGEFSRHGIVSGPQHLSAPGAVENNYPQLRPGHRLACQCAIQGDVLIDVPAQSQVHRQVVRKPAEVRDMTLDPALRLYLVQVQEPNMHDPSGDWRRVQDALEFEWNLRGLQCDLHVLQTLQKTLRQGKWHITVAVYGGSQVTAVWPGLKTGVWGLAMDIGSTTIAGHLCDMHTGEVLASSGVMNPQIRYGEDLMSRVSYAMMHQEGQAQMTHAVRTALADLARQLCAQVQTTPQDVLDVVLVGNPVMHHLLLGLDPVELGGAPFALATDQAVSLSAQELEMGLHPGARAWILPCIAGHVGADTAGVLLAERPDLDDPMTLIVDVGTNAEILLGNRHRLLACSSPTGPAFEGAQIREGQRAAPGAIERVRINPETLEAKVKVIGCDLWSDAPGFDAAVLPFGVTGICGSGIIEALAEMFLTGILLHDGTLNGACATRTPRVQADGRTFSYQLFPARGDRPAVVITQNDVRAIQLAKAALYAGVALLMEKLHVQRVDRIRLAGAFGSHIDGRYAMVLGMVPDCAIENVTSAGNAAGTGARMALLNQGARQDIEALVRRVEKIETAVEPHFQRHFVEAMALPHLTAAWPCLEQVLTLPAAPPASTAATRARSRSSRERRGLHP